MLCNALWINTVSRGYKPNEKSYYRVNFDTFHDSWIFFNRVTIFYCVLIIHQVIHTLSVVFDEWFDFFYFFSLLVII